MTSVAKIIKDTFGATLLDDKYQYQGRPTVSNGPSNNVATMPIKDLVKRKSTVILSSSDVRNTPMDILVNLCPFTMANISYKSYSDTLGMSLEDLTRMNRSTLTVVRPDDINVSDKRRNYNWVQAYTAGCQFICLNYNLGQSDESLRAYVDLFKSYAFKIKPYQMRYKPIIIEGAIPQNPELSNRSQTIASP
jgi:hypothetical protein